MSEKNINENSQLETEVKISLKWKIIFKTFAYLTGLFALIMFITTSIMVMSIPNWTESINPTGIQIGLYTYNNINGSHMYGAAIALVVFVALTFISFILSGVICWKLNRVNLWATLTVSLLMFGALFYLIIGCSASITFGEGTWLIDFISGNNPAFPNLGSFSYSAWGWVMTMIAIVISVAVLCTTFMTLKDLLLKPRLVHKII